MGDHAEYSARILASVEEYYAIGTCTFMVSKYSVVEGHVALHCLLSKPELQNYVQRSIRHLLALPTTTDCLSVQQLQVGHRFQAPGTSKITC